MERTLSNQEIVITPVAESTVIGLGTQAAVGYGYGVGDSGDDVMRSAQLSEGGDGSDGDDDNNAAGIGLQRPKQGKRARSLSINTTINTLETPDHDTNYLLVGPHLAKRQRPSLCTGDESVLKRTLQ